MILFYFIFSVYNKEKVEVKNNMGSKGRALKKRQAGGKRLFQKRRKRFKSSNNDIQSTEVVPQITPNKAVSSSSKKLNPKETLLTPSNSNEVSHHNETSHEGLPECFMLIDTRILKDVVSNIGACPICSNKINLSSDLAKKQGLAFLPYLSFDVNVVTGIKSTTQVKKLKH